MSFCGNCGSTVPTGAAFCAECGRATNEPFADPKVRAVAPDAPTTVLPKIIQATPEDPTPVAAPYSAPVAPPITTVPITTVVAKLPVSNSPASVYTSPAAQYEPYQSQAHGSQAYNAPPNQPVGQPGRGGLTIALVLLGICAAGLGIYLVNNSKDSAKDTSGSTIVGATTIVGDTTAGSTSNTTGATTTTIDPAPAAAAQLSAFVAQDRPTADTLVGSWVVQLSAKRVGLQTDGITYGPVEILADHNNLRSTYGAILVDGGAFQFKSGGSPMTGWFLTMVPVVYASKAEALQWCTDHGLGSNVCLARQFKPPNP